MTTRADIVKEARTWIGTRWHHNSATKGVGCDCVGLLREVGVATGLVPADWRTSIPGIEEFMRYGRLPINGTLERGCDRFLVAITEADAGPGDLVVMEFKGVPHHMAILADYRYGGLSIIHAYAALRAVVETRLDETMRRRIVSWHRFPGVAV